METTGPEVGERLAAEQRQSFEANGYLVLPGVLPEDECDLFSQLTDGLWVEKDLASVWDYEEGVQFVRNPLQYSAKFQRLITEPTVLEAVRSALGPEIRLSKMDSRRADPGYGNQPLHDLRRRRGRPFRKVNVIWCLDEFTARNGATRVLPGSHLDDEAFLALIEDPELPHPDEVHTEATRGSVILQNGFLIHAGSLNSSQAPRRSLQCFYSVATDPPHYDWTALPPPVQQELTPQARQLLGL